MKKLLLASLLSVCFLSNSLAQNINSNDDLGCTFGPGYWKNHSDCKTNGNGPERDETWNLIVGIDKDGNPTTGEPTIFFKSDQDHCEVFQTNPGKAGKYYILAHKYITAHLNLLRNADPSEIEDALKEATDFLNTNSPLDVKGNKELEADCVRLAGILNNFNNGSAGPVNCENIVDNDLPAVGVLSAPVNITQTSMTLNWTAATDNVGVTNYNVYKDGVLEQQVGNVLTYDVTGLTAATPYNFYITALDAEGNESGNSNTVQGLTLSITTGSTITMTSTSVSPSWQLVNVTNSGAVLEWEATNGVIGTITATGNAPELNFGANDGSPISITISSSDNFVGLTQFDLWNDESGVGARVTDLNVDNAVALEYLNTRYSPLTGLDVSNNTALTQLILRGRRQLEDQALITSGNPQLAYLQIDGTGINAVDLSGNPLLLDVRLYDARLTSAILDQVLIDLDGHGLSNGNLQIADQTTGQSISSAASAAYNSLIAKGWTIDIAEPTENKNVASKLSIYPNPVSSEVNIAFKTMFGGTAKIELFNSMGQKLRTLFYDAVEKNKEVIIECDINQIDTGLYYAIITNGNEILKEKFLIIK